MKNKIPEITATELASKLKAKEEIYLLDVREPHEYQLTNIPGSTLIPLQQLPDRIAEIDGAKPIVAYCRTGVRSAKAVSFLQGAGFTSAQNLRGGIHAWSDEVDSSVPKY